jgi:predicted DNA-binding transcriptional regulator AlpA
MTAEALFPERCLTIEEVEQRVARKKSWVYQQIREKRFPEPDDARWYESEINAYLHARRTGKLNGRKPYIP